MLPLSLTVSNQVRYLLRNLNESNSDTVFQELRQYLGYGVEASILVLQSCLDYLNVYVKDLKNMQLEPVVASIFRYLLEKPNFTTVFCEALRSTAVSGDFLENLCNALQLSASEKIGIGFALSDSENQDIRMCAKNFCMAQIEELCASHLSVDSTEQIQKILMFLRRSDGLSKHVDSFMQMLPTVQLKEDTEYILTPLLSNEKREANFFRNLDLFKESNGHDFDALQAEMEKEISIADVMREMGCGWTVNVSQCKDMLSLFSPLTESTVAKILGTIARTHADVDDNQNLFLAFCSALGTSSLSDLPPMKTWNINVLVDSIKQLAPGINWINVIESLDHEGFYIPTEAAFCLVISMYRYACKDPFPLGAICGSVWKNAEGQLSFLKYAVSVPPEVFTFAHSGRQLAYVDAVNGHKFQPGHANHAWLCLDLLEVLCQLAERGYASSVRPMLEYPLKNCPELLLLGMTHINTAFNLLPYEVTSAVFPLVLKSAVGNSMALHIWHVNPNILLRGFIDTLKMDPDYMIRVLDLCQELKILSPVLDLLPSCFGIRLAALASKKELLDLEKWFNSNLTTYKEIFFKECLKFLKEVQSGAPVALLNLYSETSSIFLKALQAHTGLISSSRLSEEIEKLNEIFMDASSRTKTGGGTVASTAKDVEAEVNSYFQQLFSGQLKIEAMIQMLARFKESSGHREQSIFNCMIANLFEEYKFFSKYPDRQLKIAAILYGLLIKFQLVTHISLGIALRAVLDALRKPADSKMFLFGVKALEQFLDRMVEWPQYCNHILQISQLRSTHSEIVSFIERSLARISLGHSEPDVGLSPIADQLHGSLSSANLEMPVSSFPPIGSRSTMPGTQVSSSSSIQLQQRQQSSLEERQKASATLPNNMKPILTPNLQPPVVPSPDAASSQKSQRADGASATLAPSPGFTRPSRSTTSTKFGSAMNIETLVAAAEKRETPIEAPASEIQDKISFIMNNLSATNVEAKSKEFTEFFREEHYPWFAQYLVMKRASIEHNHHEMYLKFLEKINSKTLNKEVVQASYENCKVLLGSELIKTSSEERSLLKNLGSWLGKITIGRNQVLRAREIDPKPLIIEAYEKGLMIAVVPFTSRILDACQTSAAYQPPNPWTMGVLGLLVEIHSMPNVKMNLKFEIEVLFKNLRVDMKDVTPTSLLKDRVREVEGNPDFSSNDFGSSQSQKVTEVKSSINQAELPPDTAGPSHPSGHSQLLSQYAPPPPPHHHHHFSSGTLTEDEKLSALGLSGPLPAAQGLPQGQLPFSIGQLHASVSNIEQQLIVNPKLHALGLQLHFQSVLPIAMDRALKEIGTSVVQRSVTIATQTTKELVLKDYAMESDETHIHNAACSMVASLAGSLANMTCKEPLRVSILSQLSSSLQGFNISTELLEQVGQLVTNDNLDLGCALIKQAATEKALQTIDGEIGHQLAIRRKHRESVGPGFFDANLYSQGYMSALPESLRPKPGHLSASQQRVYEDFVRLPLQNQSIQISNTAPSAISESPLSRGYSSACVPQSTGISSSALGNTAETDSNSTKLHSDNLIHIGVTDDAGPQNFEKNAIVTSAAPSPSPELHSVKPSKVVQEMGANNLSEPLLTTGDALDKYQSISEKLETCVSNDTKEAEFQAIIAEVRGIILRCISRDEAASAVAQKVFKRLYENASNSAHVKAHLAILAAIRDVSKLVGKELTSWVIYSDEDRKFNKGITVGLIRSELLNLAEYNVHMAKLLDAGRNKLATEFAVSLLQTLVTSDSSVISELHYLVDALAKLAAKPGYPESLKQLVEIARNPNAANVSVLPCPSVGNDENTRQTGDKKATGSSAASKEDSDTESVEPVPASFHEKVSMLFAEWYRICELPGANDEACAHFVLKLFKSGLLKGDDVTVSCFRILMEISILHCLSSEANNSTTQQSHQQVQQPLSFVAIDMYAGLVLSILKFFPGDEESSKMSVLSKVLVVTVRYIQIDAEEKKQSFNSRPYYRLFINWQMDLLYVEPVSDGVNYQVLTALANAFHLLRPLQIPGFSFAWLELVCHRNFFPKLLIGNAQKGWPYLQRLLVDLFQFLEPYLRNAELSEPVSLLYRGTLRVLLVLLHDFPEFLCDYHFNFCDVIPSTCIQMRNIILSAYPRHMRLPEPNTPNLKIDLLDEITQSPRVLSEVDAAIKAAQIKGDIDDYIMSRQQGSPFLYELKQKMILDPSEAARCGTRYNVPLMNSLVLYVGMQAGQLLQARTPQHQQTFGGNVQLSIHLVGGAVDIFKRLIIDLDTEGRYLFLNAMANQLRYPNNHTHYFSRILLHLFDESNQEVVQEQISRVLLERILVNKPHPWGLLVTFIELIKNPIYNFWNRSFIRCVPEIEKLFELVLRSCGGPKPVDDCVNDMQ